MVPPAAGPGRCRGPGLAERADAGFHVVPVRSRGIGVRLRRGHRPGSARLGLALRFLPAAVAYSRVHTGVHYPGDAVAGALIGEGTGQAVAGLMDRLPSARRPSWSGRGKQRELPDGADAEGAMIPVAALETG
ncbi:MAG: phosphatase PAP2 family protein [Trebonia sp.]